MPRTNISIETGFANDDAFCLIVVANGYEYTMPVNLDNVDDVMGMLQNTISDLNAQERVMLAQSSNENEE